MALALQEVVKLVVHFLFTDRLVLLNLAASALVKGGTAHTQLLGFLLALTLFELAEVELGVLDGRLGLRRDVRIAVNRGELGWLRGMRLLLQGFVVAGGLCWHFPTLLGVDGRLHLLLLLLLWSFPTIVGVSILLQFPVVVAIHLLVLPHFSFIPSFVINLPLYVVELPALGDYLLLQFETPPLPFNGPHLLVLLVDLLAHAPNLLVKEQLVLELFLPLSQLLGHPLLLRFEALDLLELAHTHLLPPHGVPLVQVTQELAFGLLEGLLRLVKGLVLRIRLQCLVDLLQESLVPRLVVHPLLLYSLQLLLHFPSKGY